MATYVFSFRVPKDCPVMRVGGGVEVGPVLEAAGTTLFRASANQGSPRCAR